MDALIPWLVWLVKSTLIVLIAWALVMILRASGIGAAARHRIWLATFLMLSCAPLLDLLPSILSLPVAFGQLGFAMPDLSTPGTHLPGLGASWMLGIWATGAALCLLQLIGGRALLESRWRAATPWPDAAAIRKCAAIAGIEQPIEIRFAPALDGESQIAPLTFGRRILLPDQARQWSEERLRHVLLHEFAHLRRRDSLSRIFAAVVTAAWWFNPAVWFALRALRAEQEYACDGLAVAACADPLDYAQTLVDLAPRFGHREQGGAAAIIGRSQLARRVEAIVRPPRADRRGFAARFAALVLFAALSVLVAMVRPFDPARRLAPLSPLAPSDLSLQRLGPLSSLDVVLDMDDVAEPANRR